MPYPTVLHTKAFGGLHLSLQGGEGICRSTAKAGGRNQGQGGRGMVLLPFDTYGYLFDSLSLLGCHVGAAAGCTTAGTGRIRESGKYSSTCTYTHIIKYIFSYMQYSACYMYSCYRYFENVRYISITPGESSGGYLISVISGNCNVQVRINTGHRFYVHCTVFQ